jgi:hypothetical protein
MAGRWTVLVDRTISVDRLHDIPLVKCDGQLDFLCYDNYMKIIPDPPKRVSNLDKHGMDTDLLTEAFFETAAIAPTRSGRYAAVNLFEGR